MAHWAEIDENNIVLRVLVCSNDDPNNDEGYQWLIDNLGGTWIKASFNTIGGVHYLPDDIRNEDGTRIPSGKEHVRYNYPGIGFTYDSVRDAFIAVKPEVGDWQLNEETCIWEQIEEPTE